MCDETPWNRGDINSICFEENTLEAGKYSETNKDLENFPVCIVWLKNGWKLLKTIKKSEKYLSFISTTHYQIKEIQKRKKRYFLMKVA